MTLAYGAQPSEYTTSEALIAAGALSDTDSEILDAAIINASAIIDVIVPGGFPDAVVETRKFFDIRNWPMKLPRPFSNVTAVGIDDFVVAGNWYQVTDYGLILHRGWPQYNGFFGTYGTRSYGVPGSTVSVTATWGYSEIPYGVQRAATLMALNNLPGASATGGIDISALSPKVAAISVEAFSLSLRDPSSFTAGQTTGSDEADVLLSPYKSPVGIL